jgi:hypothetical protein
VTVNSLTREKSLELDDLDRKQPLLVLPPSYVKQFPGPKKVVKKTPTRTQQKEVHPFVAEYAELDTDMLELTLVDPKLPPQNRRYAIVVHHGSTWVSVPRTWLRDLQASKGDFVDVFSDPAQPNKLFLKFRKA